MYLFVRTGPGKAASQQCVLPLRSERGKHALTMKRHERVLEALISVERWFKEIEID